MKFCFTIYHDIMSMQRYLCNVDCTASDDDEEGEGKSSIADDEDKGKISKDEEDEMVADDGHIILPDCCCLICHKYEYFQT